MKTANNYRRYSLINYFDVWGNPEDGWEVNNQCVEFDDINIADDATDGEILRFLAAIGFLREDALDRLEVEDYAVGMLEITERDSGMPVCALRENAAG